MRIDGQLLREFPVPEDFDPGSLPVSQARFAQDIAALRNLAFIAMAYDDAERSSEITRVIIASGRATVADYNQIAWEAGSLDGGVNGLCGTGCRPPTVGSSSSRFRP